VRLRQRSTVAPPPQPPYPLAVRSATAYGSRARGNEALAALGVALALDLACGEPPAAAHPVVGIGKLIAWSERRAPRSAPGQLLYGAALALGVPIGVGALAACAERVAEPLPTPARVLLLGAALKPAFALRALLGAGARLQGLLEHDDLPAARREVRALVSRDTSALDGGLLAAAAIESLAENLTDSVVAPLLAYALGDLPAAYAYRAVNTLDSMVGYRGRYEWLGKAGARLDDAANLLAARLSALLLSAAAPAIGASPRAALAGMRRDRRATASPNAGWTMAAAAGALNVRLEKRGHYVLNGAAPEPTPADIARARRLVAVASCGAALVAAGVALARRRAACR